MRSGRGHGGIEALMLSMKAKYGLKALLALAESNAEGPILIVDLSHREKIPQKFLESILLQLKRAGVLRSKKGRGGGYALNRPPEAIILGDVVRLLDGPLALVPCASLTAYRKCGDCTDEATCGIRIVMKEVRDATAGILDGTTLADLRQRERDAGGGQGAVPDWHI
jgi:Rrf2 family protein